MDTLDDVQSRFLELTRAAYKRTGSDSDTVEVSMAEAEAQLHYELLGQPGGVALWDHFMRRRAKPRSARSIRRQRARGEQVLAEAEAAVAESRAWRERQPDADQSS